METIPCYNCLCVPMCQHKTWANTMMECSLLEDFVITNRGPMKIMDFYQAFIYYYFINKSLRKESFVEIYKTINLDIAKERKESKKY